MLGSQLGIFFILILFKQLLSDKIFLEQDKNELGINLQGLITIFCSVHSK